MTARTVVLLEHEHGGEIARWVLAAAVVLAAHVGLMAAYLLVFSQHEPQGAPIPIIIDMAPMPVSPASPVDLAPGPEMVEAEPPPEPQVVEPLPPEPLIEPPPPMVEAVVTLPEPPKEPPPPPEVKEEPKPKPPEVKRVERKKPPAPRTSAAPRSERATADAPSAPSPGAVSSSAAMASWRDLVAAQLQRAKRYPGGAESRREQGVAVVSFTLSRSGSVLGRSIVRSSGYPELDREVLAMVVRASPFPAFPPNMTQASVRLSVPVRFSLR